MTLKKTATGSSRYEPEGIDNTTALNIWLSDLPDDLPNAFMSYIGYADTTAAVVSYYTAPQLNPRAAAGTDSRIFPAVGLSSVFT